MTHPHTVWIVLEYNDEETPAGIAGVFDNEDAARKCELSTYGVTRGWGREVEHCAVSSTYDDSDVRRMC